MLQTNSGQHTRHPRGISPRSRIAGSAGYTLVEVLVTLTIAAILVSIALPGMRTMVQNDRQMTQTNTLVMALNAARSEARKEDVTVNVCPSTDGLTCNTANWASGWIALSTAPVAGFAGPIIVAPALPAGTTLSARSSANGVPGGPGINTVTFLPNGMAQMDGVPFLYAEFTMCDSRGAAQAHSVELSPAGQVASASKPGFQTDNVTAVVCP